MMETKDLPDPGVTEERGHCEKHGDFQQKVYTLFDRKIRGRCPCCEAEAAEEEESRRQFEQESHRRAVVARMIESSGIPRRFIDRTLGNYVVEHDGQKRALTIAKRLVTADTEGASAIFCGKPGTGKTHLACGVARGFIETGRPARFATVLSALRHIKDTYRRDSERSESQALEDFLKPKLLALDEIGVSLGSEHEKMMVFEIINERYQNQLSTVLLSNLTRAEITEYLGHRVMDRFAEGGAVVAFDWASHRGQAA